VDARRSSGFPELHMGEQEPASSLRNALGTAGLVSAQFGPSDEKCPINKAKSVFSES